MNRTILATVVALMLLPGIAGADGNSDLTTYDPGLHTMPEPAEVEEPSDHELLLPIGPLLIERGPTVDRSIFFPLVFHQKKKGADPSTFLGIAPIFWRYRGGQDQERKGNVIFPFLWHFASPGKLAISVPPFFLQQWTGDGSFRTGIAPLFFAQRTPKLDITAILPPVLLHLETEHRKFVLATLFYYHRKGTDVDMGVPPLFFNGWNDKKGYFVIFPLAWHFENYVREKSDTVVGPVYFGRRENDWQFVLAPLLHFSGGENGSSFNLIPLFHWDNKKGGHRVVSPLGWYMNNPEKKVRGGGLLLYHQYRKEDFSFRTFFPFYFGWNADNMFRKSHLILPVGYFDNSPIHRNMSILGLYWDFHRFDEHRTFVMLPLFAHSKDLYQENHTTWVFPTFQYTKKKEQWQFNIHPLVYFNGGEDKTHQVIFPVWWRFKKPGKVTQIAFPLWWDIQNFEEKKRSSTFFPFFWRFAREAGDHTVVLNSYFFKGDSAKKSYRYVFFPLFGFGKDEAKNTQYWKILLGLVGYKTTEYKDYLYLLWLPFKVRDDTPVVAVEPKD